MKYTNNRFDTQFPAVFKSPLYWWAVVLLMGFSTSHIHAQCTDPIALYSIEAVPACGGDNGQITVQVAPGAYTWNWTPFIGWGPSAGNLPPGNYQLHLVRNNTPECTLDTTIIIAGYPAMAPAQVNAVTASNCLASNGTVALLPLNYTYAWSNTETGAFNDGLNSGIYTVTATDPATGCRSEIVAEVPNINPLQFTATVDKPSKCGRKTGQASFNISGGSGLYSYSLGGQQVFGLGPGPGMGIIVDNSSGCADTAFFDIPIVSAAGTVVVAPQMPRCAGAVGNITVEVLPGDYFTPPYSFSITRENGSPVPHPDSILAGNYLVYVADADSCVLPAQPFTMSEPAPIELAAQVIPGNCSNGGQILVTATGGTGSTIADWSDLSGVSNGFQRAHLLTGQYHVVVYDSLFCKDSLVQIAVLNDCPGIDTVHLLVPVNQTNSYCIPLPPGIEATSATTTLLLPGVTSSSSGNWALVGGCLYYTAGNTSGFNADYICLITQFASNGVSDTLCIGVSIIGTVPTAETVYFTAQINSPTVACGTIPVSVTPYLVLPLNIPGNTGFTAFGQYQIQTADACIRYTPFNTPQYFADSIAVAACTPDASMCHLISYVPSVLPYSDCSQGILAADTISLPTVDCLTGAATCVDIPYSNILNFSILDNAKPYNKGALGCKDATVVSYPVSQFPGGSGPFYLSEWFINGVPHTANFGDINELLQFMNTTDPVPGWYLENFLNLVGGNTANGYGPMHISAANGVAVVVQPALKTTPLGSELRFATGDHQVILRKIQTGCADTVVVNVECFDCPPVHPYIPDQFGNISWEAPSCAADTLFSTTIPFSSLSQWEIFDNNAPLQAINNANNAGFRLDTGYHLIRTRNTITTCEYFISFYFDCRNAPVDTIFATLKVGENISICPQQSLVAAPIITIFHVCPQKNIDPNVTIAYDETNWCALLEGTLPGLDTLCMQLCNADGQCATTLVLLDVLPAETSDKVYIFNGISPNGDGKNDQWRIVGIENYPLNKVWVYNRWGNEVFHQKQYQNNWSGTWEDKKVPAGTYYYVVDLGDGSKVLKGYLEVSW